MEAATHNGSCQGPSENGQWGGGGGDTQNDHTRGVIS